MPHQMPAPTNPIEECTVMEAAPNPMDRIPIVTCAVPKLFDVQAGIWICFSHDGVAQHLHKPRQPKMVPQKQQKPDIMANIINIPDTTDLDIIISISYCVGSL
eukprot:GHVT01049099.1.p5 GENE.GHVT01049099.1~~GHVT01049099.1.p5  ORF type:complete len:103 (-),score=5.01 GHVT01049099.1:702-1010(-)